MRILYHPKRILGFEPYVAPEGFDRKAQPVDIYDVFERYYKQHKDAKYIYSVRDNSTYSLLQCPLLSTEVFTGTNWLVSYEIGGVRYSEDIGADLGCRTTLASPITLGGTYSSIEVSSTEGFPEATPDKPMGLWLNSSFWSFYQGYTFTYTSKDETHFYGASQTLGGSGTLAIGTVTRSFYKWKAEQTKRYIIVRNTQLTMMGCNVQNALQSSAIPDSEWIYCGNWINTVNTSNGAGATTNSTKYIHIHKLSNITSYPYGCHRGTTTLTGKIYLSPSVTYLTPNNTSATTYDIYPGAFTGCSGINEHLDIPSQMIVIGGNSFAGTNIPTVSFHNNLQEIRQTAFSGCTNLLGTDGATKTLTIPNSVTHIGIQAFYNNNKIQYLVLGTSLTFIGYQAFYACTSMTGTLTIPLNVTSIGQGAFGDDNFTDIDVTANSRYEDVDDVLYEINTRTALHSVKSDAGTITFQSNTLIIGDYCCLRNQRTGTLTVPDSVTRVGIYAFYDCNGFTAISLETTTSALATIDDHAFRYCGNIAGALTIPNNVTLIDQYAFADTPKITSLTLGSGVVTIGQYAFYNMALLAGNLSIPNSVETIGAGAFYNDYLVTGTLTLGTGLKTIGGSAFFNVPFTGTLAIPSAVTAIGDAAFFNNNFSAVSSAASGFTVSDYVLYDETVSGQIKANASVRGYTGTLTFKAGTTSILYGCFYDNDNRSGAIIIPYTVTAIGDQAFRNSGGFNDTVTIGDGTNGSALTTIGYLAFSGCANITGWNIYRTPAPACNASFSNYAKPLHIKSVATGYDVTPATNAAPWTNTAVFSSVTADL